MIRLLVEERGSRLDVHIRVPLKNHGSIGLLGGLLTVEPIQETEYMLNPAEIRVIQYEMEKTAEEEIIYNRSCPINTLTYIGENHPAFGIIRFHIANTASRLYTSVTGNSY